MKPSPERHLHILHIHSHFYRSVFHLGCPYQHMRIHVYLRAFGYWDPHRTRICAFHKGPGWDGVKFRYKLKKLNRELDLHSSGFGLVVS